MSNRLIVRLASALGILLVAWGVLALVRRPVSDRSESLSIARVDTAAVDSVLITKAADSVVLCRGSNKRWLANGQPADSNNVHALLVGLADTGTTTELVAEERTSYERLGVAADSGVHVVAYSRQKPALDLVSGKHTPQYDAVYVRRPGDDGVYALHGSLMDPLTHAGDDWRDKRVVSVALDSVVTIDVDRRGEHYVLRKGSSANSWAFASGKPADSAAVASLLGNYHDVRALGFATDAQARSLDFTTPMRRVRLLSTSGRALGDLALDSAASGAWARAPSGAVVFKLDPWLYGQLAPAESTLVVKAKKPAKH